MDIKLNQKAFDRAIYIIKAGEVEHDSNNWEAVKATNDEEVRFMNTHSMEEYGQWFLGINEKMPEGSKQRYEFPYGDFSVVHRSGVEAIIKRAAQLGNKEIEDAAKKLLVIINQTKK